MDRQQIPCSCRLKDGRDNLMEYKTNSASSCEAEFELHQKKRLKMSFNPLKTGDPQRVTGKHCRHRPDAAERGIRSGPPLFAIVQPFFFRNFYII